MSDDLFHNGFRAGLRTAAHEMPGYDAMLGGDVTDMIAAAFLDLTPDADPGEEAEDRIRRLGLGNALELLPESVAGNVAQAVSSQLSMTPFGPSVGLDDDKAEAIAQALLPVVLQALRLNLPTHVRSVPSADDRENAERVLRDVARTMDILSPPSAESDEAAARRRLVETMAEAFAEVRSETERSIGTTGRTSPEPETTSAVVA